MLFVVIRITAVREWKPQLRTPRLLPSFLRDSWYFWEQQIWVIRCWFVNAEAEGRKMAAEWSWGGKSSVFVCRRRRAEAAAAASNRECRSGFSVCSLLAELRPHQRPVWYSGSFNLPPKAALHLHKGRAEDCCLEQEPFSGRNQHIDSNWFFFSSLTNFISSKWKQRSSLGVWLPSRLLVKMWGYVSVSRPPAQGGLMSPGSR